jgi:hypothetical protein
MRARPCAVVAGIMTRDPGARATSSTAAGARARWPTCRRDEVALDASAPSFPPERAGGKATRACAGRRQATDPVVGGAARPRRERQHSMPTRTLPAAPISVGRALGDDDERVVLLVVASVVDIILLG